MVVKLPTLIRHGAIYVALSTVAVAQPLLQLYGNNVAIFAAANYEGAIVVRFALAVLLVPPLVFTLIDGLAMYAIPRIEKVVHHSFVFIGLWAITSVVCRSVSFGPWVLDALFTAAIATALLVAYTRFTLVKSWITMLSPVSLLVAAVFALSAQSVIAPPDVKVLEIKKPTSTTVPGPGTPQEDLSVLWIVLDEAPLFPLLNSQGEINAKRFPGFAELAASSTWYRNVLATSQTTTYAVPSMLTGKFPRSGAGPVLGNHPKNLFTLMNGHLSMDAHEVVTSLCPWKVCSKVSVSGGDHISNPGGDISSTTTTIDPTDEFLSKTKGTPFLTFLKDALVVLGHKILPSELREELPPIDEGWGGFGTGPGLEDTIDTTVPVAPTTTIPRTEETKETADDNTVIEWQVGGPQTQIPLVEGVISRAARADRPTLHFIHALIPHRPWILAPDMRAGVRIRVNENFGQTIDDRRDRLQLLLSQYVAIDKVIADMLTTMKRTANWNRTMIIVTADHGITFQPGETHREKVNANNLGTLEDLFRVPLFIKYPDQAAPIVSDCTAMSIDLLATVSAVTGIDAGWETDGLSLQRSCPNRLSRTVSWPAGSHQMITSFEKIIDRVKFYDNWIDADGNVDDIYRSGRSGSLIGQKVPVVADVELGLRWNVKDENSFQTAGAGRFSPVVHQVEGNLIADRDFTQQEEALLVLDGVVFGVVSELAGLKKGTKTDFISVPMSRLHTPGPHKVELWVVNWANRTQPVFSRVK